MFANHNPSRWESPSYLEALQKLKNVNVPNPIEMLDEFEKAGYLISDFHREAANSQREACSCIYHFSELPKIWPLSVVRSLYKYLPENWANALARGKIGFLYSSDKNALAWPSVGEVGIFCGLSTMILAACYAASPTRLLLQTDRKSVV